MTTDTFKTFTVDIEVRDPTKVALSRAWSSLVP